MKGKIRGLKFLAILSILPFVDICKQYVKGNMNISGVIAGTCFGLVLALIALRRSFGLAKKGVFVDTMSKHGRNIMLVMLGSALTLLFVFVLVITHYFPNTASLMMNNIFNITALGFFLFVYSVTGALGIYFLERRYGQKYYFGKMEQKSC
jgi:hypothetical protein